MSNNTSFITNLSQVIAQPKQFSANFFQQKNGIILPLLLVIAVAVITQVLYFNSITLEDFINFSTRGATPEQAEMVTANMKSASLNMFLIVGTVSVAVIMVIMTAIISTYYLIVNRVSGTPEQSYGTWFSMAIWSSIPMVFSQLGAIANIIFSAPGSLAPEQLSLTSLNSLIMGREFGEPLYTLLCQADLMIFWGIAIGSLILMANKHRPASAVIIAAAPTAIILGMSALFGG